MPGEQTRSTKEIAQLRGSNPPRSPPDGVNGMTPTTTWMRLARRFGFDHNPLRRRSDLIEAWLLPAAIAAFLILSPLLVGAASRVVHDENAAVAQAQRSWHRATAVLLEAVPGPLMTDNGANTWMTWTPARWNTGGRQHVGPVPASAGTSAGSSVTIWLDRAGNVQTPPLTAVAVQDRVVLAALIALSALAAVLAAGALIGNCLLDHRRLTKWGTAWLSVGPQWSRRP
jgi:hypothetical protein